MLRITIHEQPDALTLQMEGRLAGAWVQVLQECWQSVRDCQPSAMVRVDLTGVISLDAGGRSCVSALLNGYEAARRIRNEAWGRHVVLITVTGWGQAEDKRRLKEAGFNFHLVKPVKPKVLEELLNELKR